MHSIAQSNIHGSNVQIISYLTRYNIANKSSNSMHQYVLNVKSFGAIGDGIHDDYGPITKALQSVDDRSNTVLIPKGRYLISRALQTNHEGTKILFEKGAEIISNNNITGCLILRNDYCQVLNGHFRGNGISANHIGDGFGVLLYAVSECIIKNCYFNQMSGCCIDLAFFKNKGCDHCNILKNTIFNPSFDHNIIMDASGILVGYSGSGYFHTNNLIADNYIDGNETLSHGIAIIAHGDNNTIANNFVRNCTRYGIVAYESSHVDSALTRTHILHNTVENIGDQYGKPNPYGMGIYIMRSHYSVISNNKVYNCLLNVDNSETLPCGAIADNGSCYCHIDSNTIRASKKYGIDCAYAFNTSITGNHIDSVDMSGICLINTNNNIVRANIIENTVEAGIKGYFDNLSKPAYANFGFKTFKNFTTGRGIEINHNIISSVSGKAIILSGVKGDKSKKYEDNPLLNISIQNNTIICKQASSAIQLSNTVKYKITIKNNSFNQK